MVKDKKVKIIKIVHGQGLTKALKNYENIKVYNELTAVIEDTDDVKEVQAKLRKAVDILNTKDVKVLLGEE